MITCESFASTIFEPIPCCTSEEIHATGARHLPTSTKLHFQTTEHELSVRCRTTRLHSRPIGRPKKRWEDDINVFLKQIYDETKMEETRDNRISWISAANDRKEWTRLEEKYTAQKTK